MPDKCVLDSSVIAAIFFREQASSKAVQAVENRDLLTVDLALAEVGNVAWKRVALFGENKEIIGEALKGCTEFINTACEVIKSRELLDMSFEIAVEEKITLYDSLFVAAAQREKIPLLTLDKKLKTASNTVEIL